MATKSSEPEFRPGAPAEQPRSLVLAAILAAAALMMSVTGYSFMAGNHEVYLLEPLRRAGLASFEGDWFVHDTLQYHGLFAQVAAWLLRLDAAEPAFLVIFLALLLSTAWAWWRIVRALGGDVVAFLVAVVLYHVLLGDRALGFYSLLQDGQFNAANVSAVTFLVGIAMWIERRLLWAGAAFGLAGAFHLNYAVVAVGMWVVLVGWGWITGRTSNVERRTSNVEVPEEGVPASGTSTFDVERSTFDVQPFGASLGLWLSATALALLPSLVNIALALPAKLRERAAMPLDRFVDLYVHLRHPHHYDPLAWPWWVWAAFLVPVPLAVMAYNRALNPLSPRERVAAQPPGEGRGGAPEGTSNVERRTSNVEVPEQVTNPAPALTSPSGTSTLDVGPSKFDVSEQPPSPGPTGHPLPGGEGAGSAAGCVAASRVSAWRAAARIWLILMGLQFFALLTAGVFWVSETFIQLSLWRFSPHAKLLAVSAVAVWVVGLRATGRRAAETRARSAGTVDGSGTGLPSADPWHGIAGATASPGGEAVSGSDHDPGHGLPFETSRGTRRKTDGYFEIFKISAPAALLLFLAMARLPDALGPADQVDFDSPWRDLGGNLWLVLFSLGLGLVVAAWSMRVPRTGNSRGAALFVARVTALLTLLLVPFIPVFAWRGRVVALSAVTTRHADAVLESTLWAASQSPPSATFLLPPDASAFSLHARRGQVVSFKLVPQLSGELIEWERRLREVLDVEDLSIYASGVRGYRLSQEAMRRRYDELPAEHLFEVARRYGARYVFRSREDPAIPPAAVAWRGAGGAVLYDVARLETPAAGEEPAFGPRE